MVKKLSDFVREFKLPKKEELEKAIQSFPRKWKIAFFVLFAVLLVSVSILLGKLNQTFMIEREARGGSISEGTIEAPRFINPILAFSSSDKDLTALVYSGLMRREPGGKFALDLAKEIQVSKDHLNYIFTLKDDIYFHDGKEITTEDIIFTINTLKDPLMKSPERIKWEGISAEVIDDKKVKFTLEQTYSSFLNNTTLGILPSHIWKNIPLEQISFSDFNIKAVGSGPYKIKKIKRKSRGTLDYIALKSFRGFALGKPYIKNFTIRFYESGEELLRAFGRREIDNIQAVSPELIRGLPGKDFRIETAVLPRIFGLFLNQNQAPIFTNKEVVRALEAAIDKERILGEVLFDYGVVIDSPVPRGLASVQINADDTKINAKEKIDIAVKILDENGWKLNEEGIREKDQQQLGFSIATASTPELKKTAEIIAENFREIGVKVQLKIFDVGDLNQNVIRPREYDAIFFGQVVTAESDLFAFWHSSQRNDPGLNIALYANAKVDKLLEEILATFDAEKKTEKFKQIEEEIIKDRSAIFVYSPLFIYVVRPNLNGLTLDNISSPQDRLLQIYKWHLDTEKVWKVFSKK